MIWFVRDTYPDVLQLMLDRQSLPQTWDEWHQTAESELNQASAAGDEVSKVELDPGEFLAFCVRHGLSTDAAGRKAYVVTKMDDPGAIQVR